MMEEAYRPRMDEYTGEGSITRCIALLREGDRDAAQFVWQRYFHRLVGLARARLRAAQRRVADEEDAALSALDSFFRRAGRGEFPRLDDRDDLWQILFVLTVRKSANLAKHECRMLRGGGAVHLLSELDEPGVAEVADREPPPELAAQMADECRLLLDRLGDDVLRRIANRKFEGCTNAEIAEELGCVETTVERKLQRIRLLWTRELEV
jgi:DNA-directed RNA polymerase specialized sigma24 family protein